ncbi:hypothetical protein [Neptunitalea lumnitzerae]|uniref:Uncharacterized protein n=1 Tax=Neptunitalea lumnitzerae TaxID=2965509 RepID=A0ABQ5MLV2_9FLAO|nr:hypothetical protein [Neptunitalea sp. Y10]GLB50398.1 hypothetical protein Y10_27660 [Neptunitalea sp. Y10]
MKKDFSHSKKDGFQLPDNYFEKFEENLMHTITQIKQPAELPKSSGFKVPDAYFEDVEISILAKIETENKAKFFTFQRIKKFAYSAAAIAVTALIGVWVFNSRTITSNQTLTATELETIIEEGYLPVNSYDVGEVFSDEISDISITSNMVSDEDIIDYLSIYDITQDEN